MADLHIVRAHTLGFTAARQVAQAWAEQARGEFGMECTVEEGASSDTLHFSRSGVSGSMLVHQDHFELNAKLGFLLAAFKDKIEAEIANNLDTLLAAKS